jgi:hypothetical protein
MERMPSTGTVSKAWWVIVFLVFVWPIVLPILLGAIASQGDCLNSFELGCTSDSVLIRGIAGASVFFSVTSPLVFLCGIVIAFFQILRERSTN